MSKIISYDFGHLEIGQDGSANGIIYEYAEVRKYGQVAVDALTRAGHTLINCTPPNIPMTLDQSLRYRTDKANISGSILHLCFHINAFKRTENPMGAEVEVASDEGARYGQSILKEICKLGFINRGTKRPSLWVTGHTDMVCCLLEVFFCDSSADVKLYNPQTMGMAVAQGVVNILGGDIGETILPVVEVEIPPVIPSPTPQPKQETALDKAAKYADGLVLELQQKLNKVMKSNLVCDNLFGIKTYNMLIQFQQKYLPNEVDGLAGTQTFTKLDSLIVEMNKPKPQPKPSYDFKSLQSYIHAVEDNIPGVETLSKCPIVMYGNSGNIVKWLQNRLVYLGYNCVCDGIFGNATKLTVIKWQNAKGLTPDAIIGNASWRKLLGL